MAVPACTGGGAVFAFESFVAVTPVVARFVLSYRPVVVNCFIVSCVMLHLPP